MSLSRRPASAQSAYLASDEVVDFAHPALMAQAALLRAEDAVETARRCFEFVRDEIEHSGDYRRGPTTCAASEVLSAGTGYCYAKSHLLVALLRANGLPAGFCYQRLTIDGPRPPYCLHGLAAVALPEHGWYALDPRGNKPGVCAEFRPPEEHLAFHIAHDGERDFPLIYARPLPEIVQCLRSFPTWEAVLSNLPDSSELPFAESPLQATALPASERA